MENQDFVGLRAGGLENIREICTLLSSAGIGAKIITDDSCGTNSCSPKFVVAVPKAQAADAEKHLLVQWAEQASPEEIAAASHVVDHDSDVIQCPACLTEAQPGTEVCTDCGLRLG